MSIPRVIHRLWVGGEEPEWTRAFAKTWERPGWTVRHWGDEEVEHLFPLRNETIFQRAPRLCPNHVGQLRADILRYEILERFGGVWVDADFECLRPIDELLGGVECFVARVTDRWLNNAIMGSSPGHPFLDRLIRGLPASVRRHRGAAPRKISGPQFLTRTWDRAPDVTVFDAPLFYPFLWTELDLKPGDVNPAERWPDAYAVHWWANQRRETGRALA